MKQAYKKRSPRAAAFCMPVLPDMGELFYKSGQFIKENIPSLLNDLYTIHYNYKERRKISSFFIFLLHNILYLR